MQTLDKAGSEYWTSVWQKSAVPEIVDPGQPGLDRFVQRRYHRFFQRAFHGLDTSGMKFLEVGCGASAWLPYFARAFGFDVWGIDYSEIGCAQASALLESAGIRGNIRFGDMFAPPPDMVGAFDVVWSGGVVEHFTDTRAAVEAIAKFVKPGGLVITTIPNLRGLPGIVQRMVGPEILSVHVPLGVEDLRRAHEGAGLKIVECGNLVSSNFGVLRADDEKSAGALVTRTLSRVSKLGWLVEERIGELPAASTFAGYVACIARRPAQQRKLAIIVSALSRGGAEKTVTELAREWHLRGDDVSVMTLSSAGTDAYALPPGVRRRPLDVMAPSRGLYHAVANTSRRVRALRDAIRTADPDVIVSFMDRTNILTLLAALRTGRRVVVCERTVPSEYPLGVIGERLRRILYPRAAAVVVQSEEVARWMSDFVPAHKLHVLPNFVRAAARVPESNGRSIVAVGRLADYKGFDLLIDAMRGLDADLRIYGDGPARNELQQRIDACQLSDRVRLCGDSADPWADMQAADVFVLPSRFEGFPNAVLEAMARGMAVVATDCPGGIRTIVRDGIDGVLVPAGDAAALARGIRRVLDDAEFRRTIANAATQVAHRFSPQTTMNQWNDMLATIENKNQAEDELRFGFGENWSRFLKLVDESRIDSAVASLREMLGVESLEGRRFLDIGCGSGLFSLAARRLGARVHSFDYDPQSVACTQELRRRYQPDETLWQVERGSVLDEQYMQRLGTFDVVYSWGVLHHTGSMWRAIELAMNAVAPGGTLFIAIYNDQGATSRRWTALKKLYNRAPSVGRTAIVASVGAYVAARAAAGVALSPRSLKTATKPSPRGMSRWYDLVDWVGGYPFEVARPEQIFDFAKQHGFELERLKTCGGGLGCNEFVFTQR